MRQFLRTILFPIVLLGFSALPVTAENKSFGLFPSLSGDAHIDAADIQETSLRKTVNGITLHIHLRENAREEFGKITELSIGQPVKFLICGEEISRAVVREPILSGILGFYDLQESQAKKVNDVLNGNRFCDQW